VSEHQESPASHEASSHADPHQADGHGAASASPEVHGSVPGQAASKKKLPKWLGPMSDVIQGINEGLVSQDRPTRRMSVFFYLNVLGAIAVVTIGIIGYIERSRAAKTSAAALKTAQEMEAFLKHQQEMAKRKSAQFKLGNFSIALKLPPKQRPVKGVRNLADVELTLECADQETKDYIESHVEQTKAQVVNVFTTMYREELMSKEGKDRLRQLIMDRLNIWLPEGKVTNVFFTKMLIS
jgi:flagellar basal body-associated protein FliL